MPRVRHAIFGILPGNDLSSGLPRNAFSRDQRWPYNPDDRCLNHLADVDNADRAAFDALPLRIFLNSCTVQTLGKYGEFIYDGGPIGDDDRIHRMPDGLEEISLRYATFAGSRAERSFPG